MITYGWFDWIDAYPIWLQLAIGTIIGLVCMAIITFSVIGIKLIIKHIKRILQSVAQ